MKVSVIIPNYNYARFLQRRIDCIVNQTVKPSEIIFLDDCSTDDSLVIAESILSDYDIRYKIISNQENQGVFKQWLKGFELAEHEYIWIAEADDYCELNFLENMLVGFSKDEVCIVNCESRIVDELGNEITNSIVQKESMFKLIDVWRGEYCSTNVEEIMERMFLDNSICNVSSVIFNKNRIKLADCNLVSHYKFCGDWLFYILCLSSYSDNMFVHKSELLNYHVIHGKSVFGGIVKEVAFANETIQIVNYLILNYKFSDEKISAMLSRVFEVTRYHDASLEFYNVFLKMLASSNCGSAIFQKYLNSQIDSVAWLESQLEYKDSCISQLIQENLDKTNILTCMQSNVNWKMFQLFKPIRNFIKKFLNFF